MYLKRIAELSPLILAFLIFLGFFKLDWYYYHWNINISHYLDFSEILLSFFQDLNIILFFIIILAAQSIFGFLAIDSLDKKALKELHESERHKHKSIVDHLDEQFEKNRKGSLIALAIMTLIFGVLFWWLMSLTSLYLTFLMFVQLIAFFFDKYISGKESIVNPVVLIIAFLAFTFCIAQYEINQTEKNSIQYCLKTTKGEVVSTNSKLLYLGKTNGYFFLFDTQNRKSEIMKSDDISEITIIKKTS